MPCTYYTPEEERHLASVEASEAKRELRIATTKVNDTVRILCSVMTKLEKNDMLSEATIDARKWWKEHQKNDQARKHLSKKKAKK